MDIKEKSNEKIEIEKYYKILSKEFPNFLIKYINTKEMQKQSKISVSCGTIYSKLFNQIWYSSLDHSIAVALIIWNFTKDKKQTLSGLFHDISTPVFKHTIDFLNKDYEKQESTEDLTKKTIINSTEIMELLKEDNIKIDEICNYHIYPIADNDTPHLSSDRLEYTLSNGLGVTDKLWNLEEVEEIYQNIEVQKNEEGIDELGFKNIEIAEKFVHNMSILSRKYNSNKTVYSMQFLADIVKEMTEKKILNINDLYNMSEKEIIEKIKKCNEIADFYKKEKYKNQNILEKNHDDFYKESLEKKETNNTSKKLNSEESISKVFKDWENAIEINTSNVIPNGKYYVSVKKVKIRYINPLVKTNIGYKRIYSISENAKKDIDEALKHKNSKFIYL